MAGTKSKASVPERYVDIAWVATFLGVKERWVRDQVLYRNIPYHKFGQLLRFDRLEIEAWASGRRVEPNGDASWDE